ncbi:MAG: 3D domain-containing protein [Verrucomicrobia bacterium]|nr:3D domain-containing protein [Verrucomicrobiota bacterium]MBU4291583.1 3D domain-containing protein [Verrucomicrobiota bacterium]MBU4429487.1 3D domain-containing protein [Verrucomicrobiota bacterium]MCG2679814.1 3D domain-containing protein [Kiritimatiellia bacterium]
MTIIHDLLKYAGWTCALMVIALNAGCASIRPPAGARAVENKLLITAYCKCRKCCGWERSWFGRPVYLSGPAKGQPKQVGVTASGTRANKGTIAADLSIYPFNTIMYVPDYGYGRVEDCGGGITGNHIEVFFSSHKQALKWGKQTKQVKIWLP